LPTQIEKKLESGRIKVTDLIQSTNEKQLGLGAFV